MWEIPFVLVAVAIVTGNVTVLVVFTRTPSLRKRKHYLLVSLAVADLFVGVISVPMFVMIFLDRNTQTLKTVYQIQDILFGTASVFGLTAVAIERTYAVYYPLKHRVIWKGVYLIGIAVIWIMAGFFAFCSIFFHEVLLLRTILIAAPITFSLVVIIVSYSLIWTKINCMTAVQGQAIHGRDKKLTITLLIVTVVSLIAWIPFQALTVLANLCGKGCSYNLYIVTGTVFLHYSNSLVNPIIYALRMPQFKTELLHRLRSCVTCHISYEPEHDNRPNNNRTNDGNNDRRHDNNVNNDMNAVGSLENNMYELRVSTNDNQTRD